MGRNLLRIAAEEADQRSRAHARERVRYRRKTASGWQEVELLACLGARERSAIFGGTGRAVFQAGELDFLITAADLDFGAGLASPIEGDEIETWHDNGRRQVYRVTKRDGRPFSLADEFGVCLRVFATLAVSESL